MFFIEVVDPDTGRSLPEGEVGTLCVTPLWTNHATPFLRWNSGDLVSYASRSAGTGRFAELFPVIRHANRTTGLFQGPRRQRQSRRIRRFHVPQPGSPGFSGGAGDGSKHRSRKPARTDRDQRIVERRRGVRGSGRRGEANLRDFPVQFRCLQRGTLAAEFERSLKAPRFVDRRQ